jgi:hypothetical protein
MTIGIHYKGKLKSEDEYIKLTNTVRFHAGQYRWLTEEYADTNEILIRTDTEDGGKFTVSKYHGPVKGIIIYPPHYESLMFKFDSDLYCQWSCKIQSVPSNIHIRVIELFDMIHPLFEFIDIQDDSEYWVHRDKHRLEQVLRNDPDTSDIKGGYPKKNRQGPPEDVAV